MKNSNTIANATVNFQATFMDNNSNVIFVPSGQLITAGTADYQFTVIPVAGFIGGNVNCTITGTLRNGGLCNYTFSINLPRCTRSRNKGGAENGYDLSEENLPKITIAPNPAKEYTNITYNDLTLNSSIKIYDLTGRLLDIYKTNDTLGNWQVKTNAMPKGLYLIVTEEKNTIISQIKLLID